MSRYIRKRYIDAEVLKSYLNPVSRKTDSHFVQLIDNIPTADVEEVKHGKWEHGREVHREYIGDALIAVYYDEWWCSQCHYTIDDRYYGKITYKRCPECGAHMDKEKEK